MESTRSIRQSGTRSRKPEKTRPQEASHRNPRKTIKIASTMLLPYLNPLFSTRAKLLFRSRWLVGREGLKALTIFAFTRWVHKPGWGVCDPWGPGGGGLWGLPPADFASPHSRTFSCAGFFRSGIFFVHACFVLETSSLSFCSWGNYFPLLASKLFFSKAPPHLGKNDEQKRDVFQMTTT